MDGETVAEGGRFVWFNSALQKDRSIAVGFSVTGQRDPLGNPDYRWDEHPIQFRVNCT